MRMFSMSLYIRLHADYNNAREPCNINGTNAWFKSKSGWVKLLINTLYFARYFCKWCLSIMLIWIADSLFMHNIGVFVFCKKLRKLGRLVCMTNSFLLYWCFTISYSYSFTLEHFVKGRTKFVHIILYDLVINLFLYISSNLIWTI